MPSAPAPRIAPPAPAPVGGRDPLRRVPPPVLLGAGILSVQVGAGIAARTFGAITPAGLTGLRLWTAALLLAALGGRPALRRARAIAAERAWRDAAVATGFGVALAVMNFSIYQAFARIPLGIAVTIEFLGPLGVAVASSRRLVDLAWVGLAGTGVTLLGFAGTGAAHPASAAPAGAATVTGVGFALVAGASWAAYILLSASTGRRFAGASGLTVAVAVASAGAALLRPAVLAAGLAIGLLSSVIPYRFELETLRRVPPRVFGIWMSLEPAVAAGVGFVLLGQALAAAQWIAICCVIVASAGAALGAGRAPEPQA